MKKMLSVIILLIISCLELAWAEDSLGNRHFPSSITTRPDFVIGLYVSESEGAQREVLIALYIDSKQNCGSIAWGDGKSVAIGNSETAFIRSLLLPVISHRMPAEDPFACDLGGNDFFQHRCSCSLLVS